MALLAVPQLALALSPYQPPEQRIKDFNGVDLAGSTWNKTETFLTIGDPANGGLSWSYSGVNSNDSNTGLLHLNTIATMSGGFPSYSASAGDMTTVFAQAGPSAASNYAILAHVGSTWTVTTNNGTIYTYDELVSYSTYDSFSKLLTVQKPNGNVITVNYTSCPSAPLSCRISSVVSNMGYALKYDYDGSGNLIKVWAVNLAAHVCDATVTTCDGYDNYITKNISTGAVTDSQGNTTIMASDWCGATGEKQCLYFYQSPSGAQITTTYDYYGRIETLTNAVGTWTYTYTDLQPGDTDHKGPHKTVVKDPNNVIYMQSSATLSDPRVLWKKDGLARQTTYSYMGFELPGTYPGYANTTLPAGATLPEGNYVTYTYDSYGRVTLVTNTPKSGSGLSNTSISATYESTCANLKTCAQPLTTTDARGKTTSYSYDATHGGVLTVTSPADGAGLTPKTVYTYAQATAQTKTGPSTMANAGTIWMKTVTSTCSTAATCDGTAGQLTVSRVYLGYNLLPNWETTTSGDGVLSFTTFFGYDNIGNTVSIDGPRTDVDDTSYKTYDANRKPVFEISVDPDGAGSLKRTMVKHSYDADGREYRTDSGSGNATNGSDFVTSSFKRVTFDAVGRPIKTETVQP